MISNEDGGTVRFMQSAVSATEFDAGARVSCADDFPRAEALARRVRRGSALGGDEVDEYVGRTIADGFGRAGNSEAEGAEAGEAEEVGP